MSGTQNTDLPNGLVSSLVNMLAGCEGSAILTWCFLLWMCVSTCFWPMMRTSHKWHFQRTERSVVLIENTYPYPPSSNSTLTDSKRFSSRSLEDSSCNIRHKWTVTAVDNCDHKTYITNILFTTQHVQNKCRRHTFFVLYFMKLPLKQTI